MDQPTKRDRATAEASQDESRRSFPPQTLIHPISPPAKKRRLPDPTDGQSAAGFSGAAPATSPASSAATSKRTFKSPFQLTKIRDLSQDLNRDTISLKDILGDPLIAECWSFNYLHDIDFTMAAFDDDVRHLVKVHIVHGFWKKEDPRRLGLEAKASRHTNVSLHPAYLPEMFGTHHSKMMILLRHDETAQIIIHTANMITRDWTNMTQAVWSSPMLPLLAGNRQDDATTHDEPKMGSGEKFKVDLISYLRAYEKHRRTCKPIIDELVKYDFSAIRGALIASVPGRFNVNDDSPTRWGWAAMMQALRAVPVRPGKAEIVIQISSIATLGPTNSWLKNTFFQALSGGRGVGLSTPKPDFKVVFPTADEIRKSLDGYASGGSIHTKIQSSQQAKQLQYLRPLFCHWANDSDDGEKLGDDDAVVKEAGRQRAAPHIKTYIRYADKSDKTIDWALVTSANLSKQAWGDAKTSTGEMRVSSYEIGVLVWPELFSDDGVMSATFLTDTVAEEEGDQDKSVVGLRLPYNLPLQRYGKQEVPWVATASHTEPDWRGGIWRDE